MNRQELWESIRWDEKGLIPVIVQDSHAKKVRMLAYMNQEALRQTLATGKVHYYSRSRDELWLKGETSGQYQMVKGLSIDCDGDTLLLQVEQVTGISCHTGHATCFYRVLEEEEKTITEETVLHSTNATKKKEDNKGEEALRYLEGVIEERRQTPQSGSYTNYLLEQGENKILKKVGEECTEVVIAAKDQQNSELILEVADLMYHLTVLLSFKGVKWEQVEAELEKRK